MSKKAKEKIKVEVVSPQKLNSKGLQNILWETLQDLKSEKVDAATANAIVRQARGIIEITRAQLSLAKITGKKPDEQITGFITGQ